MEIKEIKQMLLANHNIILHGAPGTGKTYLAKEIAKAMCGVNDIKELEDSDQFKMVQFHPSYDYTDFVEGLRPTDKDEDGNKLDAMQFVRKDGVFKEFCKRAINATLIESVSANNNSDIVTKEELDKAWWELVADIKKTENGIKLQQKGNKKSSNPSGDWVSIPLKDAKKGIIGLVLNKSNRDKLEGFTLEKCEKIFSDKSIENVEGLSPITVGELSKVAAENYAWPIVYELCQRIKKNRSTTARDNKSSFVFLIDEINRGDMSKIFGELFYAIDPGYRGEDGKIDTQYQNLVTEKYKDENGHEHKDPFHKGFYVPDNVYIIGTMNDIDRSVESMDFAMRRRFQFIEVTAEDRAEGMELKKKKEGKDEYDETKAYKRMTNLNNCIISKEIGLSKAYQIGGSYFLKEKIKDGKKIYMPIKSDEELENLWDYRLKGLLREYLRGEEDKVIEEKLEKILKPAFNCENVYRYNEKGELYKTQNIQTGGNDSGANTETDTKTSES